MKNSIRFIELAKKISFDDRVIKSTYRVGLSSENTDQENIKKLAKFLKELMEEKKDA